MLRRYRRQYGEIILLTAMIAACAFLIHVGLQIPVGRSKTLITPSTWPVACLLLIAGCSLALILLRLIQKSAPARDAAASGEETEERHPRRALYTIVFIVGYMALVPYAGFVVTSIVSVGLFMFSLKVRRIYAVLIPVLLTALLTGIFAIALQVPLPRGMGLFQEFSQLFF